jgi:hypothetical protein
MCAEPGDAGVNGHLLGIADRQLVLSVVIFLTISLYCAPLVLFALFRIWIRATTRLDVDAEIHAE